MNPLLKLLKQNGFRIVELSMLGFLAFNQLQGKVEVQQADLTRVESAVQNLTEKVEDLANAQIEANTKNATKIEALEKRMDRAESKIFTMNNKDIPAVISLNPTMLKLDKEEDDPEKDPELNDNSQKPRDVVAILLNRFLPNFSNNENGRANQKSGKTY